MHARTHSAPKKVKKRFNAGFYVGVEVAKNSERALQFPLFGPNIWPKESEGVLPGFRADIEVGGIAVCGVVLVCCVCVFCEMGIACLVCVYTILFHSHRHAQLHTHN